MSAWLVKPPLKLKNRSIIKKDGVLNAHNNDTLLRTVPSKGIDPTLIGPSAQ
jgi:hypothetical protein